MKPSKKRAAVDTPAKRHPEGVLLAGPSLYACMRNCETVPSLADIFSSFKVKTFLKKKSSLLTRSI